MKVFHRQCIIDSHGSYGTAYKGSQQGDCRALRCIFKGRSSRPRCSHFLSMLWRTNRIKSLYDIAKTLRTEELNVWARAKSCQLSPLAARICQSYTRWPFGLDLLTQLCQTVHFRNAMLRVEPSIIHDILSRASEDEEVGNQVRCISRPARSGY